MKYSQAVLIACVGGAAVASAFTTSHPHAARDLQDDALTLRDLLDGGLSLRTVKSPPGGVAAPLKGSKKAGVPAPAQGGTGVAKKTWSKMTNAEKTKFKAEKKSRRNKKQGKGGSPPPPGSVKARDLDYGVSVRELEDMLLAARDDVERGIAARDLDDALSLRDVGGRLEPRLRLIEWLTGWRAKGAEDGANKNQQEPDKPQVKMVSPRSGSSGGTAAPSVVRDFEADLVARYLDEELAMRDLDEGLSMRDFDELEMRQFFDELDARQVNELD